MDSTGAIDACGAFISTRLPTRPLLVLYPRVVATYVASACGGLCLRTITTGCDCCLRVATFSDAAVGSAFAASAWLPTQSAQRSTLVVTNVVPTVALYYCGTHPVLKPDPTICNKIAASVVGTKRSSKIVLSKISHRS
ncbi:hypothetical protein B296_00037599 [Ensete ventricosum]|uniref:Uncharacterized protein n=1 Tax=Ensete ventricosum TaxID=4639 RepID=A0A426YT64_ENSVE|nr:hypothetical protein B296_00037599 [Ensete ventricosum]